jgi:hypothetical protein
MTPFRKLWTTLVDSIKPQAQLRREANQTGLHAIVVDTRPFNTSSFSHKGR